MRGWLEHLTRLLTDRPCEYQHRYLPTVILISFKCTLSFSVSILPLAPEDELSTFNDSNRGLSWDIVVHSVHLHRTVSKVRLAEEARAAV